jgi:putative membrane protein
MSEVNANGKVWKGAVAGLVGGLVASFVMTQFQGVWSAAGEALGQKQSEPQQKNDGDDATVKTAKAIAEPILNRPLKKSEKKSAGPMVHYAFGGLMGAAYGAASEVMPSSRKWLGLPYGAALFVGADEIAVPALGLSESPEKTPISMHLNGFVSHLVYAVSLETVRRSVRRVL